jgi:hypothetical protein
MAYQYRPPVSTDKSASYAPLTQPGLHRGKVTRVDAAGIYVVIPTVNPAATFGPSKYITHGIPAYTLNKTTTTVTDTSVTTGFVPVTVSSKSVLNGATLTSSAAFVDVPTVGSNVLCAFLDGREEEVVILGVLRP